MDRFVLPEGLHGDEIGADVLKRDAQRCLPTAIVIRPSVVADPQRSGGGGLAERGSHPVTGSSEVQLGKEIRGESAALAVAARKLAKRSSCGKVVNS